jgi:hypothetical protein
LPTETNTNGCKLYGEPKPPASVKSVSFTTGLSDSYPNPTPKITGITYGQIYDTLVNGNNTMVRKPRGING